MEEPGEQESYFAEEALVGNHFLLESVSDYGGQALTSRLGVDRRIPDEEVFGMMFETPEDQFATSEIWGLDPEGFEGDILDIVFSDSFQNLRGKAQHGPITHFINRLPVSRFEHSVDCFFLLRSLGAKSDVEIGPGLQIYTMGHDMGQGGFSHTSEDVIGGGHEVHEERAREVLKAEGLWKGEDEGGILDRYGEIFSDNYRLMDASKPDLSIDRLAYILKDGSRLKGPEAFFYDNLTGNLPGEEPEEDSFEWLAVKEILDATEIHEEGDERYLVMTDPEVAGELAELYMDLEERVYFNPGYNAFNRGFADSMRIALHNGHMDAGDLFSLPDRELVNFIGEDPEAREHLEKVFENFLYEDGLEVTEEDADFTIELRRDVLDPKVREGEESFEDMERASQYDEDLRQRKDEHTELDGREVGFNVIGWDYPVVEPYSLEGEIPVKEYRVSRISEPGTENRAGFWRELKERYSEEDRKAAQAKI